MQIQRFLVHAVTECGGCGQLLVVKAASPRADLEALHDKYEDHMNGSPRCREWHDSLPNLYDLRGALNQTLHS